MKRASAFLSVTMIKHLKKDHPKAFLTGLEKNEQNKHWKSVTNLFSKSWNIKLETFLIKYFSIRSTESWSNSNWNWKEILCVAWLEVVLYKSVTDTRSTSCQWKRCIRNLMVLSDWQEFIIWICIPPIITCDWYENGTCCIERSREISKNILCEEFHPIVIFIILMFASFHLDEGIALNFSDRVILVMNDCILGPLLIILSKKKRRGFASYVEVCPRPKELLNWS